MDPKHVVIAMDKFIKALLLGTAAGIIDVIPMVLQGLSWQANLSALLHWVALGIIITFARLPLSHWLSGMVIAVLTGIPIAVLATETTPMAWFPILVASIVLGSLLGYMSEKLILNQ